MKNPTELFITKDLNGRKYLRLADAREGQMVELDDGFTCHCEGKVELLNNEHGLYFLCEDGTHHIHDQADDGIHCIGIYP